MPARPRRERHMTVEVDADGLTRMYVATGYFGITHHLPRMLSRIWRYVCCRRGWHLFDECYGDDHNLVCDACQLYVHIARIEVGYMDRAARRHHSEVLAGNR